MEECIIIGSGCAGSTAAIYAARAGLSPIVIEGTQPGGLLTTTTEVENFPGFPTGVPGFDLTFNMRAQAERFGARFEYGVVESVAFDESGSEHIIKTEDNTYKAKTVIIATGSTPRKLNIPGETEYSFGKGVTYCATCDGAFYAGKRVVVVGGGDTACEDALYLTKYTEHVYLIHRRDKLRASDVMAKRVMNHPKISVMFDVWPTHIYGNEEGVASIDLFTKHSDRVMIDCQGVFIAIGHTLNSSWFEDKIDNSVTTRWPGVFKAGDCTDPVYRQAIVAAGMGCQAAIQATRYLETL